MMRAMVLSLAALVSASAFAVPGLNLAPMEGEKKVDVVKTENYTGSCGSAVVRVLGVEYFYDGNTSFRAELDGAKVIVRNNSKEVELNMGNGLDAVTGVSCIPTKGGNRLVVWTNCGGNGCPDFYFTVIDPEKPVIIAPKNPIKEVCDEKCVTRVLGRKLPVSLSQ